MLIQRKSRIDASIDLTPLIDVVFQLLIFLMVASNFTKPESFVDLPTAPDSAVPSDRPAEKITVTINPDDTILLDSEPLPLADLAATILARTAATGITRAEIRGDKASNLGTFVTVMETLRGNGIQSVGLVKQLPDEGAH